MSKRDAIDPVARRQAEKPVRYPFARRWLDGRRGRTDGRADLLLSWLPAELSRSGIATSALDGDGCALAPTPGVIDHEFRTAAEQAHIEAEAELRGAVARRETVRRVLGQAEERVQNSRKRLDEFGESPSVEQLGRRGAAEAHQADEVIAMRNVRRFAAERAPLVAEEAAAVAAVTALRTEWAELTGVIVARRALAAIRVARLHDHALRRCRTYERRLVLHHTRGSELLQLLSVSRPRLPDWTAGWSTRTADDELPPTV